MRILDQGSGMEKIRIRDKHPGSATLIQSAKLRYYSNPEVGIGTSPPPHPQANVFPSPPLVSGGDTLACGRGGSQFGRVDSHCGTLGIHIGMFCVYFFQVLR
jgi:hypothetical protein